MDNLRGAIIFAMPGYEQMAQSISESHEGFLVGEIKREQFPDGEIGTQIVTDVVNENVILIGATHSDTATMQIYDISCAITKYGAKSLTLIVPYFGCSTMERAVHSGEVVTAKTRARLLSSIPRAQMKNRVLLLDLHADGIVHYFEGDITATHVYGKPVIKQAIDWIIEPYQKHSFVLASTDMGRAKWVESLGNDLGMDTAFIEKKRIDGHTTAVRHVIGEVFQRRVILYDDMIRTGGSLVSAANAYMEEGATSVSVVSTHGVWAGDGLDKVYHSGVFDHIAVTDSHPKSIALASTKMDNFRVFPTYQLFTEHLRNL
jgi:ribose-phosphate pyrophosphokinase